MLLLFASAIIVTVPACLPFTMATDHLSLRFHV